MADVTDRDRTEAPPEAPGRRARPVVLGTLSAGIDPSAEEMAIASALEAGVPLVIANMLHLPPYPATVTLVGAANATLPHEEALEEVRGTAARAASLGVKTELLRVTTRHPVRALLQIVVERDAGLLVFGPDRARVRGLRRRAAVRRVRRDAPCLVWVAPDG